MKKLLKIIGIAIVLFIALLVIILFIPMTPNNYTKEVKTGGDIEIKYLSMGDYKVRKVKKRWLRNNEEILYLLS